MSITIKIKNRSELKLTKYLVYEENILAQLQKTSKIS